MSPTSYQTAPPRVKAGPRVYGPNPRGSTELRETTRPATAGLVRYGTEEGTRTPTAYGHYHLKVACLPIPPPRQRGLLLLRRCWHVGLLRCRLLLLKHRNVFDDRLLLHFKYRRIRQTCLRQIISFLFSKEG